MVHIQLQKIYLEKTLVFLELTVPPKAKEENFSFHHDCYLVIYSLNTLEMRLERMEKHCKKMFL